MLKLVFFQHAFNLNQGSNNEAAADAQTAMEEFSQRVVLGVAFKLKIRVFNNVFMIKIT